MCVRESQEALTVCPSDATLLGSAQPCLSHTSVTHSRLMKATAALIHVDAFTISIRHCSFSLNLHPHLHFQLRNWMGHWFSAGRRVGWKCTYFFLMSTKSTIKSKLEFFFQWWYFQNPGSGFSFLLLITLFSFLFSDSGERYVDSLDSMPSYRQHTNRKVSLATLFTFILIAVIFIYFA